MNPDDLLNDTFLLELFDIELFSKDLHHNLLPISRPKRLKVALGLDYKLGFEI